MPGHFFWNFWRPCFAHFIPYMSWKCIYFWFCFEKFAQIIIAWIRGTGSSGRRVIWCTGVIVAFSWRERLKLPTPSLRIASLRAEIRTRNLMEVCDLVSKSVWFVSSFLSVICVDVDLLQIKSGADGANKQCRYY